MVSVNNIYNKLTELGTDMFTGVPDSLLKNFCAYVTDNAPEGHHIIAANEGNAVGIAAGHYLATRKPALVYMQNSGEGNAVNPLLSLADKKVYSIPMILMIGWRGEPNVHDEPQHVKQGEVTVSLLETMDIPYVVLSTEEDEALKQVEQAFSKTVELSSPVAIVIRKGTFGSYKLQNASRNDNPLSREEAMKLVVDSLNDSDVVVSTTGKLSRELFEYREEKKQGHGHDFLTVGSMGHSSSIALGIAMAKPNRRIFCFDGDGALIMHTGALGIVAAQNPKNFFHILFNNGAHESVGGQPTVGYKIKPAEIALAMGYKKAVTATTRQEITDALNMLSNCEGPVLIELKVKIDSRDNLGRPTTTPEQNKEDFMNFLSK